MEAAPTLDLGLLCGHGDEDFCGCALAVGPRGVAQRMEEMEFARSACSAAQQGNVPKLQRILERNPDEVHSDGVRGGTSGYTPLHYAARAGHVAAVRLLLQHGARVDACTREGQATPLHRAAAQGHVPVAEALLAAGADANKQDSDGETALHKAASAGHAAMCQLLMKHSPDAALLKDRRGMTPAERAQNSAIRALLAASGS